MARPSSGAAASAVETQKLKAAIGDLAEVRSPREAEEPILAPHARAAVFEWLAEIRAQAELKAVGLKPRSTALLHGPPGCGKTTLAHHLAARLGIPMVIVGAENLNSKWLGDSEKAVAALFRTLETSGVRCVVFLDEMEAIGRRRDLAGEGSAARQNIGMLGVLLRKIEEFEGLLLGATNRAEDLDPALWRRFGMQIVVDLPTADERFAILKRYFLPFEWREDDLDLLVDVTEGASPALLRGLAEGVKRSLMLAPKMRRDVSLPSAVFGPLVLSIRPPPEFDGKIPLWCKGGELLASFDAAMAWPPMRADVKGWDGAAEPAAAEPTEPKGGGDE